MARKDPHPQTLFHLVPTTEVAHDALLHPDNEHFVSPSRDGSPGLEVGYHVPSIPQGHVITRLGRNADLILRHTNPRQPMSAVHVTFEIDKLTQLVVLSVQSPRVSLVRLSVLQSKDNSTSVQEVPGDQSAAERIPSGYVPGEQITGGGVIVYGQDYELSIASYGFNLLWPNDNFESLKTFTIQAYLISQERMQDVGSRHQPTEVANSEAASWHMTRLRAEKNPRFKDIPSLRERIGSGTFGVVYKAFDQISGNAFAIKVVKLEEYGHGEELRHYLHREIKIMQRLSHPHIIEHLGHAHFDTLSPEIFMPLREGNLTELFTTGKFSDRKATCLAVMGQMLRALDYLASEKLVHRDLKPDNILYYTSPDTGDYHFQLADFGLVQYQSQAKTFCGTAYYQAPELWPEKSKVRASQSTKMDVWSLLATLAAINSSFRDFPPCSSDYGDVLRALESIASQSKLEPMARLHPDCRASAAQMLLLMFDGVGLTTPRSKIPPIEPKADKVSQASPTPPAAGGSSRQPETKNDGDQALPGPAAAIRPLSVFPRPAPPLPGKAPPRAFCSHATGRQEARGGVLPQEPPALPASRVHRDGIDLPPLPPLARPLRGPLAPIQPVVAKRRGDLLPQEPPAPPASRVHRDVVELRRLPLARPPRRLFALMQPVIAKRGGDLLPQEPPAPPARPVHRDVVEKRRSGSPVARAKAPAWRERRRSPRATAVPEDPCVPEDPHVSEDLHVPGAYVD